MSTRLCMFCSNPVNGGTAEIFSEVTKEIVSRGLPIKVVPCVNAGNSVKVYSTLENIKRLKIYSQAQALGEAKIEGPMFKRLFKRIIRELKYAKQKKINIDTVKNFLKGQCIDTVIIHNGGYLGDDLCNQVIKAAFKAKVKNRIMVFHSDIHKNNLQKLLCIVYDMQINRFATKTVTVSRFTRERMLSNSFLKKNMKVIYNGITFENIIDREQKKKDVGYKTADIHIGMIGNFQDNKGQLQFLEALTKVLDMTDKNLQVIMIGNVYNEAYYQKCRKYIDEHDLDKFICVCHNIYNAKEYMDLFDLTVIPSMYDESFGLIGIESMRSSVPVVAFKCGGIPEVVQNGLSGYIVSLGDTKALAESIVKLINNPKLRIKLGKQGRLEYEKRFTRKAMGDKYLKLIYE